VVTLGTLYMFRGVDYSWATGRQINASDMPPGFLRMGTATLLGVPVLALFAVAVILLAGFYLRSYSSGRELYAIGSDPVAARLSGIAVGRRVFAAFVVSGALAGLAGVLYAARFGTLDANAGLGSELNVVAAVVVGGWPSSVAAGRSTVPPLGAVLLTTIGAALPVLGVNPFWQRAARRCAHHRRDRPGPGPGGPADRPSQGEETCLALSPPPTVARVGAAVPWDRGTWW